MAEEELDLFKDMDSEESDSIVLDDFNEGDEDMDRGTLSTDEDESEDLDFDFDDEEDEKSEEKKSVVPPDGKKEKGGVTKEKRGAVAASDKGGVAASEKKRRRGLSAVLYLMLGLGLLLFYNDFNDKNISDTVLDQIPIVDEPIVVAEIPEEELEVPEPEDTFIITDEDPPTPPKQPYQWHVQVGVCRFEICVNKITSRLQELGYGVTKVVSKRSAPLIHVITKSSYPLERVTNMVSAVEGNPMENIYPVKFRSGSRYRMSLGYFPTVENAKIIREYVEKYIFKEEVLFSMNRVYRISNFIKVMTGPYSDLPQARQTLRDLRDFTEFKDAFLVRSEAKTNS